ncbi:MAG: HEAT repeat domain-containing protein [Fimbriimonadaceae bacterium]
MRRAEAQGARGERALLAGLQSPDEAVATQCALALNDMKSQRAVPIMERLVRSRSPRSDIGFACIGALAAIGSPRSFDLFRWLITTNDGAGSDYNAVKEAMLGIAKIGDRRGVAAIAPLVGSSRWGIPAVHCLALLGGRRRPPSCSEGAPS